MLCGSPLGELLNGSQVSTLPVATSSRCTPAKPLFCVHTLPSTCECCGLTMLTCAASMFCSAGSFQVGKFVVLGANLTMGGLYMVPRHRAPRGVGRRAEQPRREAGLLHVDGIFRDLPGLRIEPAEVLLAEAGVPG